MRSAWFFILWSGLATGLVRADTIHVPDDMPTIQAAVNAAQPNDTIVVGPGTWIGEIILTTTGVTLRSEAGAAQTVLKSPFGLEALLLIGIAQPSMTCRIEGFTITGSMSAGLASDGGNPGCVVTRCVFEDNPGRGLRVFSGSLTVEDCVFRRNQGGGSQGAVNLKRCLFEQNHSAGAGGGSQSDTGGTVRDCLYVGNTSAVAGGAIAGNLSVIDSTLRGNHAPLGGGIHRSGGDAFQLLGTTLIGNVASVSGGGAYLASTAVDHVADSISVARCRFADNLAPVADGLLLVTASGASPSGRARVLQSTFVDDGVVGTSELWVENSILRGSRPPLQAAGPLTLRYCDVSGGAPGLGNIDAPPGFVDEAGRVLCLLPDSPCIDAGDPFVFDPDGSVVDMGAAAFAPSCDAGHALFGDLGLPELVVDGSFAPLTPYEATLTRGPPSASVFVVLGASTVFAPLKGGVLVPDAQVLLPLVTDGAGALALPGLWPAGVPAGVLVWLQAWGPSTVQAPGFSASNGVVLITP